jgi:perosamine synthetase
MKPIPRKNLDYGLGDLLATWRACLRPPEPRLPSWLKQVADRPGVLVNSGRAGILLALRALDLPSGSKIGVPLYCCPTVFEAITLAGHRPEFVDIELPNYGLSARTVAAKAPDLAALIVVHMFGLPTDVAAIQEVVGTIPIIEDCAHAFGSRYHGGPVGASGVASVYSFGPGKWPSCGGGGAVLGAPGMVLAAERLLETGASDPPLGHQATQALRAWLRGVRYRSPGQVRRRLGTVTQTNDLSAEWHVPGAHPEKALPRAMAVAERAVLERKVRVFGDQLARQRRNAQVVREALRGTRVILPEFPSEAEPNYYVLPLRFAGEADLLTVQRALAVAGIETHRYLRGVSRIAARHYGYTGGCPNSEVAEHTVLWTPLYHGLEADEVQWVAATIRQALDRDTASVVAERGANADAPV